ncbi:MAG: permease-like cell division protein FtsX, partial [Elusimicrobiota bacterium]|nr:permease-like cell division protein FtsX [Elusimicrobiota bacterium]
MSARSRAAWLFALGAGVGLAVATLLFLERQSARLEAALREDFRVVFFLRGAVDEPRLRVLEERLLAAPEAAEVRYVSPKEALESLRREDPELVEAVALVGDNPLPGSFEVKPAPDALATLPRWIAEAARGGDWADVRHKPGQLQAALQARFYGRLLRLVLDTLLCLAAALVLSALAAARAAPPSAARWRDAAASAAGTAA